ncbi:hypothetical protein CRUP_026768, partial [Coryphaenoides rupestris]
WRAARQQVDTSAAAAVQTDHLTLCQRLAAVEQALTRQLTTLQTGVQDYETFNSQLDSLARWISEPEEVLRAQDPNGSSDLSLIQDRMEQLKRLMLKFSSMAPDLERQQTFLEKCETWMEFLVQTEENMAVEISGNYHSLVEQQKAHELFQAEMFSRQQILHSIISDGQRMLEQGQVDDRDEFNLKLALLSNQWQGVVRRAQQRRGIIDGLVRQWQRYRDMADKLRRWLLEVAPPLPAATDTAPDTAGTGPLRSGATVPLQQARAMLDAIQGELTLIQDGWRHANASLDAHKRALATLLKDWERCERGIGGSLEKLRAFKRQLSQPLPDLHEDLQGEQMRCKAPPLHPSPSSHLQGGELSGEGLLHGGQALAEGQVVRLHGGGGRRVHLLPQLLAQLLQHLQ